MREFDSVNVKVMGMDADALDAVRPLARRGGSPHTTRAAGGFALGGGPGVGTPAAPTTVEKVLAGLRPKAQERRPRP